VVAEVDMNMEIKGLPLKITKEFFLRVNEWPQTGLRRELRPGRKAQNSQTGRGKPRRQRREFGPRNLP
jgi:hypothetical protein